MFPRKKVDCTKYILRFGLVLYNKDPAAKVRPFAKGLFKTFCTDQCHVKAELPNGGIGYDIP